MKKLLFFVACLLLITLLVIGCEEENDNENDNFIRITFDYSDHTDVQWDKKFASVIVLESGEKIGSLPNPSKTGYSFAGWFTKDGKKVTDSTRFDDDTIIYAKFNLYHLCVYVRDDALSEDPTCDSDGVIIEKCSCGKQNTKIVEATGHDYEASREEPTCNVCKVCGEYEPR